MPSEKSPFLETERERFQLSFGTLMVVMVIMATMMAGLLFATRLPLITNELKAWFGQVPSSSDLTGNERRTQLYFLLFCYSSPLLMTAFLHLMVTTVRSAVRWSERSKANDEEFEMEPHS
jgi:hypothetical protein